jgi:hypothetical protein
MRGRIGVAVLAALVVLAGPIDASAKQRRFGRCRLRPDASLVARTPRVVVSSVPETEVVDAEPVTNPAYFTCLRRTGERHRLFTASSDPSPDAGYQSDLAALRAAGHYVLYVSEFTQNNPDGPATDSASFHVVDVARHNRQTIALPDPNAGLTGLGEVAVSVDGYIGWAQVENGETIETVEADTGSGPITLATAPTPGPVAFHKLAFRGETLTWLYHGRPQSAKLEPPTSRKAAIGSLSTGSGSALAYSVQTNTTANAFELSIPEGDSIAGTSTPPGFSCTDTGSVEKCKNGGIRPNTPLTGSFDHTGTISADCFCVQVAFSADDGATWLASATLTGPTSVSPRTSTSLTLSCPATAPAGKDFGVSGVLTPPSAAVVPTTPPFGPLVAITYTPPSGSPFTHDPQIGSDGGYSDSNYSSSPTQSGTWTIHASFLGSSQYAPSQSPVCTTSVQ